MELQPTQNTVKGPADWFTGDVWIDAVARGRDPSRLNVGAVHFSPGARTAWHSHDGGQTLYVTEGRGRVQSRGDELVPFADHVVVLVHDRVPAGYAAHAVVVGAAVDIFEQERR